MPVILPYNPIQPQFLTASPLPPAMVGTAYSASIEAYGGAGRPYTFSILSDIPDTGNWLTLNPATGDLTGTPTTVETETITVQVTDSAGTASPPRTFTLVVNQQVVSSPLNVVTLTLGPAVAGSFYPGLVGASGGTRPYTYTITGAPAWMTVQTDGNIFGTPPATGTVQLTAQATDSSVPPLVSPTVTVTLTIVSSVGTFFGAQLPLPVTTFSTTSSPPTPANTNRGSYYTPGVGGDASLTLQAALNAAAAATGNKGDVIVVQGGTTYTQATSFLLPIRSGTGVIYLIASTAPDIGGTGLPAAGTRAKRTDLPNMASLRVTNANNACLSRPAGAGVSSYRLIGIDIELTDPVTNTYVVAFGRQDTQLATLPQNITLDRCYVAGGVTGGVSKGIGLEGNFMEVTESTIERVWLVGNGDTNAIVILNSTGPYKIHNNFLEGFGETFLTGGGDTVLPGGTMISDLTFTNNHCRKANGTGLANFTAGSTTVTITSVTSGEFVPVTDFNDVSGTAGFTANPYIVSQLTGAYGQAGTYQLSGAPANTVTGVSVRCYTWRYGKNAFEMKNIRRAFIDSNFFEHAYAGGQSRSALVLTARNQGAGNPWYGLFDVTFTNNIFTDCFNGGINWLVCDSEAAQHATQPGQRLLLRNNLLMLSNNDHTSSTSAGFILSNNAPAGTAGGKGTDIIWDHNTLVGPNGMQSLIGLSSTAANMALSNVVWSNNIWDVPQFAFLKGGSAASWSATFPPQINPVTFINNVLPGTASDTTVPAGNFQPANAAAVGYTSYGSISAAAGYALTSGSAYHAAGVDGTGLAFNASGTPDGTDIGCNISKLPTS